MPRSKTGNKRLSISKNNITAAVKSVLEGRLSFREAEKEFLISKSTLARHVQHHKTSGAKEFIYEKKNDVKKVFSNDEEEELAEYLKQAARLHYGLTKNEVKSLAFQYAKGNAKLYPKSGSRRKAKSCILIDSPIKAEIEATKQRSAAKKRRKRPPPRQNSSSESDVDEPILSNTDDDSIDYDQTDILEEEIKKGDYLLTKVAGKKSTNFYVSEVVEVLNNEEFQVKFLKRLGDSNKFICGAENCYDILLSDIECKLPHPISTGGSERQISQLTFQVDFTSYNVK